MATHKTMSPEAVIEFLSTPAPREATLLELFELADPARELTYPDMLTECCKLLGRAAEELRRRGDPADAQRHIKDALCLAAVANLILGLEDAAEKSRIQDVDEPGLARLIELANWLTPRTKTVEPIIEALRGIKPGILAYLDEACPLEDGPDDDR